MTHHLSGWICTYDLYIWWMWKILFLPAASDLGRCHYGDRECLKRTINSYAILLKNGRRDLNLVPIDPLQVDEVNINQGSTSQVNINLRFRDLKCYGLSKAVIKDIMYVFIFRSLNKFIFWLLFVASDSTGALNEIQQHRNSNLLPAYHAFHWLVHTKLAGISYCCRLMVMDQPTWHLVSFPNRNQKSIHSC